MTPATHNEHGPTPERVLCRAWERSAPTWTLGFPTGPGHKPRERGVAARPQARVRQEVPQAKHRCGLPDSAPVVSGDDAGRAGCWLHRLLQAPGSTNPVGDSSSIAGNRRQRRAQSDGLDVRKLVSMLLRLHQGAREVWRVVQVPSVAAEEGRHRHRDLESLTQERARPPARIKGVRSSQGLRLTSLRKWPEPLDARRLWDGAPLPRGLRRRVLRGSGHHPFWREQMAEVEAERRALLATSQDARIEQVRQRMGLRGLGIKGAGLWVMALFGWRDFHNRRAGGG